MKWIREGVQATIRRGRKNPRPSDVPSKGPPSRSQQQRQQQQQQPKRYSQAGNPERNSVAVPREHVASASPAPYNPDFAPDGTLMEELPDYSH